VTKVWLPLDVLEKQFPSFRWREPMPVETRLGSGLGCRVCIANDGLRAAEVLRLPQTREDWDDHFRQHLR
jgi:hypothetical protein